MILEPRIIKSVTVSTVSPSICHEVMGPDARIIVFCMLNFKPAFSLSSFTFIKRIFTSSVVPDSDTHGTIARKASLSNKKSWSLLKLVSIMSQPTISSSVVPFSSHLQSFPASRSLPRSQFLTSAVQSIG